MPRQAFNLSDLNGMNGFAINGVDANDLSGDPVSSAGDVNGDGVADVMIGASRADPDGRVSAGESYLLFGHVGVWPPSIALSTLNGTDGVVIQGIDADDYSGGSVSAAGDVNGDGVADVMIGAYSANPDDRSLAGESYLLFGHGGVWPASIALSRLNGTDGVVIQGIDAGDLSGSSVSAAGDVNGDGVADVMIGASGANLDGRSNVGESYLLFGHTGVWPASIGLSTLNGTDGVVIQGIDAGDRSGSSVSAAGDVNGDGVADVMIGASGADPDGRRNAGESYLLFGHAGVWPASIGLSTLNGTDGVVIQGIDGDGFSGVSVSAAGDVNGDGMADVMIGAYRADPDGRRSAGESYLLFGHGGVWPASIALSRLNGTDGVVIQGIDVDDYSGISVSAAGDVNGDGVADVMIGAYFAYPDGRVEAGESYLLFGHAGVWPASIELSTLNGTDGVVIQGIDAGDFSGISVSAAGDVNGDGVADVMIGAYAADPDGRTGVGQSYVVFGGAEQFNHNQILIEPGGTLRLNASHIEIEPNLASRVINVTNVAHGYFAFISNSSVAVYSFTQGQINNNEVLFIHDGSDQAPSYTLSAEGITRIFSDVHPQAANVSFVLSSSTTSALPETTTTDTSISTHSLTSETITDTSTSTHSSISETTTTDTSTSTHSSISETMVTDTSTHSSTSETTMTDTSTPTTPTFLSRSVLFFNASSSISEMASTLLPTTVLSLLNSTLSSGITSSTTKTTGLIDQESSSDTSSNQVSLIVGVIIGISIMLVFVILYGRRQQRQKQNVPVDNFVETNRAVGMIHNPLHSGSRSMSRSQVTESTGDYLDVMGAEEFTESGTNIKIDQSCYIADINETSTDYEEPVALVKQEATEALGRVSNSSILMQGYDVPVELRAAENGDQQTRLDLPVDAQGYQVPVSNQQASKSNQDDTYRLFSNNGLSEDARATQRETPASYEYVASKIQIASMGRDC